MRELISHQQGENSLSWGRLAKHAFSSPMLANDFLDADQSIHSEDQQSPNYGTASCEKGKSVSSTFTNLCNSVYPRIPSLPVLSFLHNHRNMDLGLQIKVDVSYKLEVPYCNVSLLLPLIQSSPLNLTESELALYDGSDPNKPIYLAIEYC